MLRRVMHPATFVPPSSRMRRRLVLGAASSGALGVSGGAGLLLANERHDLRVVVTQVGTPGAGRPLRIAQLSDLHLRDDAAFHARIAARVARIAPDLLALTGDLVDEHTPPAALDAFLAVLPRMPLAFAVTGNHEYQARWNLDRLGDTLGRHGVTLLRDRTHRVETPAGALHVAGLDVGMRAGPALAHAWRFPLPDDDLPVLALTHFPASAVPLADRFRDRSLLALAGHAHGGQVSLLGRAPWRPPGSTGTVDGRELSAFDGPLHLGRATAYVSTGVGNSMLEFRLGATPTIDLLSWWPGVRTS